MSLRKRAMIILVVTAVVGVPFLLAPAAEHTLEKRIADLEKQLPGVRGKEKIDVLNRLAALTYTSAPGKCIEYCNQAIDLERRVCYPVGKAKALYLMSYALSVLGDWEKPFIYTKEALAIYEKERDPRGIAKALCVLGYFYTRIDYYNTALDYFLKAQRIIEELHDDDGLYYPFVSIGSLYFNMEDYARSLDYYQKALAIANKTPGNRGIPYCLHSIGLCYQELGDTGKALDNFLNSLKLFEADGDEFWIAGAKGSIGVIYIKQKKYDLALTYLAQSRQLRKKVGDQLGLFAALCTTGDCYVELKDFSRAQSFYDEAFPIAEKLGDKNNLELFYKQYSRLFAAKGDYKKAYEYYIKYAGIRDDLFNEKKNRHIDELQVQFDSEKRAREIELLKKDNKIQVITRNTFIAGFFLVTIILVLLFKKYLYLLAFWKKQKYIGQYRVIKTIGFGGMGSVYLGHPIREKNRLVALKVLKEELLEDENSRSRFKHEGTVIDKLLHPNIVKVFERGEYKGKLYIAMEYLQGITLGQKIKEENTLAIKECLAIMTQITDALAFIHAKSIVHRDLKPANIMLVPDETRGGVVKLLDFGVALTKFQTRLTQSGILVGTLHYIAPEQITDNLYSSASDIYSLGITFYEMLVGEPAFPADTITGVVEKILEEIPKEPKQRRVDTPDALNRLILDMLAKKPEQRPAAQDVLTILKGMEKEQSW